MPLATLSLVALLITLPLVLSPNPSRPLDHPGSERCPSSRTGINALMASYQTNATHQRPEVRTFVGASGADVGYHQSLSTVSSAQKMTTTTITGPPLKRQKINNTPPVEKISTTLGATDSSSPQIPPPKRNQGVSVLMKDLIDAIPELEGFLLECDAYQPLQPKSSTGALLVQSNRIRVHHYTGWRSGTAPFLSIGGLTTWVW
ncbi:hypothetical protein JAAARDRAFT_200171 [Jaapia argillacea MUCL 33604]|uniref:Uncharacterized protein n=1 Tax=Jaapia argillacea MUCL 33604 TaxID=933084 RepID=A0A067PGL1_9AGAM|nr:hypothetical protein JAAARDRAFT_200171 [Jaapia argillacea MUCL 33604]